MSYNRNVSAESFSDCWNNTIRLSFESWEHIQKAHPEITHEHIAEALVEPDEVRRSRYKENVILYYRLKVKEGGKQRFSVVVVKSTKKGYFIMTAMTVSGVKKGQIVYQREPGGLDDGNDV